MNDEFTVEVFSVPFFSHSLSPELASLSVSNFACTASRILISMILLFLCWASNRIRVNEKWNCFRFHEFIRHLFLLPFWRLTK